MNDSRLIKMLRTFSDSEFRDLEKFVESPYFSQGRDLSKFFKTLKPFYPDFEDSKFTLENLYAELCPGKEYDEKSSGNLLYKLSSELYKLCREFLIQSGFNMDSGRRKFYLLNQLREKKLYKEFGKEYHNSEAPDEYSLKGGVNDFLNRYFLEESFLEYSIAAGDIRSTFDSILKLGEYSVIAALIKGFRNIDTNLTSKHFNIEVRYNLVDNFVKHLDSENLLREMKDNNDEFYTYAVISYAIHKMCKYPEKNEYYFKFKELVFIYLHDFGHSEKYILFQTLLSYCVRKLDGADRELFIREEFENYKSAFEFGFYKYNKNDKININAFRNIIGCAVDNSETDWLERFAEDYISELHEEYRDNMKSYTLAYVNFERKNFEEALECISNIKYDLFLFKMDIKNLMVRVYFELQYYEQAISALDAMKHYISNTKELSEKFKLSEAAFIRYTGELLKARTKGNKIDVTYFKRILNEEKNLSSRKWLLEKISEL